MKIILSKSQWEKIGMETGWIMAKKKDKVDIYKSIRKPMPKPTKIIEDDKRKEKKFDWRKEINED